MDICLSQLPTIIEEGTAFRVSLSAVRRGLQSTSQVWGPGCRGVRGRRPLCVAHVHGHGETLKRPARGKTLPLTRVAPCRLPPAAPPPPVPPVPPPPTVSAVAGAPGHWWPCLGAPGGRAHPRGRRPRHSSPVGPGSWIPLVSLLSLEGRSPLAAARAAPTFGLRMRFRVFWAPTAGSQAWSCPRAPCRGKHT